MEFVTLSEEGHRAVKTVAGLRFFIGKNRGTKAGETVVHATLPQRRDNLRFSINEDLRQSSPTGPPPRVGRRAANRRIVAAPPHNRGAAFYQEHEKTKKDACLDSIRM
jgi:hypothetical protein